MISKHSTATSLLPETVIRRMCFGATIGLLVISFFVFGVDKPNPDWPKHWIIKPLLVTPIIAAIGTGFTYLFDGIRHQGGWKTFAAFVVSFWFSSLHYGWALCSA